MQHLFTTRTSSVARAATVLAALATFVAFQPQHAVAQYIFKSGGVNWGATGRWTGGTAGTIPNAVDATATFNLPLSNDANPPAASFTMNLANSIPAPGTITIGGMIVNNTAGNTFDTTFGNSSTLPGFVFQVSSGTAAYTESAGTSDGSTSIIVPITLMSDLVVTQNHVDSNNLNAGTTFSNKINAASGLKFVKEGVANLNLTYAGAFGVGEGFFGTYEFNQGAVRFISNTLLQNAAGVTVKSGAQMQIGISADTTFSLASGAVLSLDGTGATGGPSNNEGALRFQMNGGLTAEVTSPVLLSTVGSSATITVQTNGSSTGTAVARLSGVISGVAGDGGFLKTGTGDLYLVGSGSNTYQGGTGITGTGSLYLNKSGGAIAVPGTLSVGGTSLVVVQQNEQIADNALVRFTSTTPLAGTLRIGGFNRQETVGAINSLNTNSGTIEANNGSAASVSSLTVAGTQTSKFDGLVRDNENTGTLPGKLAIAKTGAESLELTNGTNSYSGGTTVSGGKLIVSNTSGSATGTGSVTLSGTGSLNGNGIVSGDVVVNAGGHVAPGTSTGVLTVGSANFATPTSALDIEIGGTVLNPGTQVDFDQLAVSNAATLGGALNVSLINGFTPAINDVFRILTAGSSVSGTFASTSLPALPSGSAWNVNYASNYVELAVVPGSAGVPGDFNSDGKVDAADYVVWRKADGTNNALPNDNGLGVPIGASHYTLWRSTYGNPPGSGSGSDLTGGNVPEPSTLILLAFVAPFFGRRLFRRIR